jgi:hypothetical protein
MVRRGAERDGGRDAVLASVPDDVAATTVTAGGKRQAPGPRDRTCEDALGGLHGGGRGPRRFDDVRKRDDRRSESELEPCGDDRIVGAAVTFLRGSKDQEQPIEFPQLRHL